MNADCKMKSVDKERSSVIVVAVSVSERFTATLLVKVRVAFGVFDAVDWPPRTSRIKNHEKSDGAGIVSWADRET